MDKIESLSLRDLRILTTLAERKHFAKTAAEFDLSQASLSAIVKKIEGIFGQALFTRSSRRVTLTPEGEAVVRQAHAVLGEAERLAGALHTDHAPLTGRFRLGVFPTLGPYLIPLALPTLLETYPTLELVLTEALTDELLVRLRSRQLDGVLVALPQEAGDLSVYPLFRESFQLAVSLAHPLAARERITVDEVPINELLLLEPGHCLRDQVLSACGTGFLAHRRVVHRVGLETLLALVAAGRGCAVVPTLAALHPAPDLRVVPFAPPAPGRTIALVTRRGVGDERDALSLAAFFRRLAEFAASTAGIDSLSPMPV
jgi:LysR family transcriptional regulator, hydrogen peroxide-inducible genes activator